MTAGGTSGTVAGTARPKKGSVCVATPSSAPERAARTIARDQEIFIRLPTPAAPPDQPVLRSQTRLLWRSRSVPSISAYTVGCQTRKTAPKQAEKVAWGSVTPRSVPATLAV